MRDSMGSGEGVSEWAFRGGAGQLHSRSGSGCEGCAEGAAGAEGAGGAEGAEGAEGAGGA